MSNNDIATETELNFSIWETHPELIPQMESILDKAYEDNCCEVAEVDVEPRLNSDPNSEKITASVFFACGQTVEIHIPK